jgi:hypothetical protein
VDEGAVGLAEDALQELEVVGQGQVGVVVLGDVVGWEVTIRCSERSGMALICSALAGRMVLSRAGGNGCSGSGGAGASEGWSAYSCEP